MLDIPIRSRSQTTNIVIHAALTYPGQHVDSKVIRGWHVSRGFSDIGYHFVIRDDGVVEMGRRLEAVGAHTLNGYNSKSVGIVLAGGLRRLTPDEPHNGPFARAAIGYKDTAIAANFTAPQLKAARVLVTSLLKVYPGAKVLGHRDATGDHRVCPTFDAERWFEEGMPTSVATSPG